MLRSCDKNSQVFQIHGKTIDQRQLNQKLIENHEVLCETYIDVPVIDFIQSIDFSRISKDLLQQQMQNFNFCSNLEINTNISIADILKKCNALSKNFYSILVTSEAPSSQFKAISFLPSSHVPISSKDDSDFNKIANDIIEALKRLAGQKNLMNCFEIFLFGTNMNCEN